MEPAVAAVMILLSCQASVCRPIDTPTTVYNSVDECRASLIQHLARSPSGEVIGRCREVDPTVTGSLPAGYTTVTVTHGSGNDVTSYIVPRKAD
jgi:hypothetical protein